MKALPVWLRELQSLCYLFPKTDSTQMGGYRKEGGSQLSHSRSQLRATPPQKKTSSDSASKRGPPKKRLENSLLDLRFESEKRRAKKPRPNKARGKASASSRRRAFLWAGGARGVPGGGEAAGAAAAPRRGDDTSSRTTGSRGSAWGFRRVSS